MEDKMTLNINDQILLDCSNLSTILICLYENGLCMELEEMIDILVGIDNVFTNEHSLNELKTYATLKFLSKMQIQEIIDYLLRENYIYKNEESVYYSFSALILNKKGYDSLKSCEFMRYAFKENNVLNISYSTNDFDFKLFENLKATRLKLAMIEQKLAFQICNDKVLMEIVKQTPPNIESFSKIKGIGPNFLKKYATIFMKDIAKYKLANLTFSYNDFICKNKSMVLNEGINYYELVEYFLFASIDCKRRELLLKKHPNSKDALVKKVRILDKYVWAMQPCDLPDEFSFPYHFEIYKNIYTEINDKNACELYWYFLYFYSSFSFGFNNTYGFLNWYNGASNGYYVNNEGSFYIDINEINKQVNSMKSFFDKNKSVWFYNVFTHQDLYVESIYARLTSYHNESSKVLIRRFMNVDIEFTDLVYSAFYIEAFFKQYKYKNFLDFFKAYKELLLQVKLRDNFY